MLFHFTGDLTGGAEMSYWFHTRDSGGQRSLNSVSISIRGILLLAAIVAWVVLTFVSRLF